MSSSRRQPQSLTDDEHFVRAVYRAILGREADGPGLTFHKNRLRNGEATWESVLSDFVRSEEFRISFASRQHLETLHNARKLLFQRYIPAAKRILDLGGAAEHNPEGGLFAIGYPHSPDVLTIVDLPPEQRFSGAD